MKKKGGKNQRLYILIGIYLAMVIRESIFEKSNNAVHPLKSDFQGVGLAASESDINHIITCSSI